MGYAVGADPDEFSRLRPDAIVYLRFVAAFALFNGMSIMFVSAIKGAGDTAFVFWVSLVMSLLLVLGSGLSIYFGLSSFALWTLLTLWIAVFGMIYMLRFLQGRWRVMRVIDVPG